MLKVCSAASPNLLPLDAAPSLSRTPSPTPPMDTLELAPGQGVGPFRIGDSLWAVLDMLRARKTEVPKVEVSWDPDHAPTSAVTVHAGPVTLLFPATRQQRLSHIFIGGLEAAPLTLTYEGTVLSSRSHPLTRAGVARALGPTYAADGAARLTYPGVAFEFSGTGGNKDAVVAVHVTPRDEELPASGVAEVTLIPGRGATLEMPGGPLEITLGETSAQDMLLDLGPPLRKYWKEDDRMDRMWGQPAPPVSGDSPSTACFWNYFQHGLDFLIADGVVTKIIAHSNIPGTPQFQQYARCPWAVQTDGGVLDITSPLAMFRSQLASEGTPRGEASLSTPEPEARPSSSGGKKKKKNGNGNGNGGGGKTTPSEEPRPAGTTQEVPPDAMVLDRSVEGGLDGVVGVSRSQLVGFDGLVAEVDEASGAVSSIQVWR